MKFWSFLTFTAVLVTKFEKFRFFSRSCGNKSGVNLEAMCTHSVSPRRFYAVNGFEDRKNDVVHVPPLVEADDPSVVVFFPGDVQDYTENMEAHRDNKYHKQWNLESTAEKLQQKFDDCHILIMKPSRMGFKTFSCFENFVPSNQLGVPEHTSNHNALRHLNSLLKNVSERLSKESHTSNSTDDFENATYCKNPHFEESKLKLIGFSKGCVVLNQFLHEFHFNSVEKNSEIGSIVSKIKDMYWLDGGHSGGVNTWVTDKNILCSLNLLEINIHVHVTPYQIRDDRRPWIKKEEKAFSEYLTKHGCKIDRMVHFEAVLPSIVTHFDLINAFKKLLNGIDIVGLLRGTQQTKKKTRWYDCKYCLFILASEYEMSQSLQSTLSLNFEIDCV